MENALVISFSLLPIYPHCCQLLCPHLLLQLVYCYTSLRNLSGVCRDTRATTSIALCDMLPFKHKLNCLSTLKKNNCPQILISHIAVLYLRSVIRAKKSFHFSSTKADVENIFEAPRTRRERADEVLAERV